MLQFTYSLLMLAGWLWLANACGAKIPLTPRVASILFVLGLLPVLYVPVIYLSFVGLKGDYMGNYMEQFTQLMKVGGSFAPVPLGLAVFTESWWEGAQQRPIRNVRHCCRPCSCLPLVAG